MLRVCVAVLGMLLAGQAFAQEFAHDSECAKVDAEANFKSLGVDFYPPVKTMGNFVPAVTVGKIMFLAGNGPRLADGKYVTGKVGEGHLTVEQGYEASKLAAISMLSNIKSELGDLNRVKRLIKVFGMVNADPSFTAHPKVINGFSDLMIKVFGDCGKHARSAVGVSGLVGDITVEIEMVAELR